jgi:hypothetical protein
MNFYLRVFVLVIALCLISGTVTALEETRSPTDLLAKLMQSKTAQFSFFRTEHRIPLQRSPPRAIYQDEKKALFTILENPSTYVGKAMTTGSDDFYPVGASLIDLDLSALVLINKEKIFVSIDNGYGGQEVETLNPTAAAQIFNWFGNADVRNFGFVNLNAPLEISDDQLQKVKEAALGGDAVASTRLYVYYNIIKDDDLETLKWMRLAAVQGDVKAQYNLGELYLTSQTFKDIHLARIWLGKAAQSGNSEAKAELLSIKGD